jgi:hypothetical protein
MIIFDYLLNNLLCFKYLYLYQRIAYKILFFSILAHFKQNNNKYNTIKKKMK